MIDVIHNILLDYLLSEDQSKIFSIFSNFNSTQNKYKNLIYLDKIHLMQNLIKQKKYKQYLWYSELPEPDNLEELVLAHGDVKMLKLVKNHTLYHLNIAIKFNNSKIINYLIDKHIQLNLKSLENAVRYGHLKLVKFILQKNIQFGNNLLLLACKSKKLDMVKFIYTLIKIRIYKFLHRGIILYDKMNTNFIHLAIMNASTYDIVIYLYNNIRTDFFILHKVEFKKDPELINLACVNNDIRLVKWYVDFGIQIQIQSLEYALWYNHFKLFKWLLKYKSYNFKILGLLAKHGYYNLLNTQLPNISNTNESRDPFVHIDCFLSLEKQFRLAKKYPNIIYTYICYNGDINYLTYLENQGYCATTSALNYAIIGGHLNIIKYLHIKFNNIHLDTLIYCILYNRLEILKYLDTNIIHDIKFWKAINIAITKKYYELVQYIYIKSIYSIDEFITYIIFDREFYTFMKYK